MRILIFEYVTGGGFCDSEIIPSIAQEGDMMMRALLQDLEAIDGVTVTSIRDDRFSPLPASVDCRYVSSWDEAEAQWQQCLLDVDAVWPVVPESGGLLELFCEEVLAAGCTLLNSRPQAVRLAASKRKTIQCLQQTGVVAVETWELEQIPTERAELWVMKPEDGMGCLHTHLFSDAELMTEFAQMQSYQGDWIVQPYLEGQSASLSLMVNEVGVFLLGVNLLRIAQVNDGFALLGCVVNGLKVELDTYQQLAKAVVAAIPGLWGYVGVDFILTSEGPVILEINPRVTTAYVGLSQSLGRNVAQMLLGLAQPLALDANGQDIQSVDVEFSCAV